MNRRHDAMLPLARSILTICLFLALLPVARARPDAEPRRTPKLKPEPSLPSPAPSPTPDVRWDDCEVSAAPGTTVRRVRCEGVELRLMRAESLRGPRGVNTMLQLAGLDPQAATTQMTVGSHSFAVAQQLAGPQSRYIAVPLPDTLLVCMTDASQLAARCEPRIAWVASHGLPPGVTFPAPNLSLSGAKLHVPEGCSLVGGERIVCGAVSLDWREQPPPTQDWFITQARTFAAAGVEIKNTEARACALGGVAGRGQVLSVLALGHPLTIMSCVVERIDAISIANCIGVDPRLVSSYPPPCDQAFGTSTGASKAVATQPATR